MNDTVLGEMLEHMCQLDDDCEYLVYRLPFGPAIEADAVNPLQRYPTFVFGVLDHVGQIGMVAFEVNGDLSSDCRLSPIADHFECHFAIGSLGSVNSSPHSATDHARGRKGSEVAWRW